MASLSWRRAQARVFAAELIGVALGLFAESGENRRTKDEEGEDRQHRQIGEIAGMDEAVVIRSHQRALGDFPRARTGSDLQFDAAAQIAGFPAPLLG